MRLLGELFGEGCVCIILAGEDTELANTLSQEDVVPDTNLAAVLACLHAGN